jgi:hypothetical protein
MDKFFKSNGKMPGLHFMLAFKDPLDTSEFEALEEVDANVLGESTMSKYLSSKITEESSETGIDEDTMKDCLCIVKIYDSILKAYMKFDDLSLSYFKLDHSSQLV